MHIFVIQRERQLLVRRHRIMNYNVRNFTNSRERTSCPIGQNQRHYEVVLAEKVAFKLLSIWKRDRDRCASANGSESRNPRILEIPGILDLACDAFQISGDRMAARAI